MILEAVTGATAAWAGAWGKAKEERERPPLGAASPGLASRPQGPEDVRRRKGPLSCCFCQETRTPEPGTAFSFKDFLGNMQAYESDFLRWAQKTDVLLCCHFWEPEAPVYLSEDDLRREDVRIRMIGDVTCDIQGSVKSTIRSSTHDAPYFDYNPFRHS